MLPDEKQVLEYSHNINSQYTPQPDEQIEYVVEDIPLIGRLIQDIQHNTNTKG